MKAHGSPQSGNIINYRRRKAVANCTLWYSSNHIRYPKPLGAWDYSIGYISTRCGSSLLQKCTWYSQICTLQHLQRCSKEMNMFNLFMMIHGSPQSGNISNCSRTSRDAGHGLQVVIHSGEPHSIPKTLSSLESWLRYTFQHDVVIPLLQADCTYIRMSMTTTMVIITSTNILPALT